MQFQISSRRETVKEIRKSSKQQFSKKKLGNNFTLSDTKQNTSKPLNRGDTAYSPSLRTLLVICQ